MRLVSFRSLLFGFAAALGLAALAIPAPLCGQSSSSSSSSQQREGSQSNSNNSFPDDTSSGSNGPQSFVREKTPTLDPAGPTISLISPEPVFAMAAGLNMCGYDDGLQTSEPVRQQVRDEINKALTASEDARKSRDALCLYVAQHRMTGTGMDVAQYISLSLYITPPPNMATSAELAEMPPDATQVAEIVPLLSKFAAAVDIHGIWLTLRHTYDEAANEVHGPLSKMMVATNLYLKMPAPTYDGRRFIIVVEPMLSPNTVNARIYGTDYVVVLSPANGTIHMNDVHHTYLHYLIDPLLYSRTNALEREQPILKEIREAPLDYVYRSDTVALTVECMIKAIEARTMDTGIPNYKMPAKFDRSELPHYDHERQLVEQKQEAVRQAALTHDMKQGFVLTQYFYGVLVQFEKDPASLPDTMGEIVYGMDVDQQVHRVRALEFDRVSDQEVLGRSKPHKVEGMDLAESKLSKGDVAGAAAMAEAELAKQPAGAEPTQASAHAYFILARAAVMTGHPDQAIEDFQKTLASTKEQRLQAWSHIYLGRMLDLDCKRDEALSEYKLALTVRDGRDDTRAAAERGVKNAYSVNGHTCEDNSDDEPNPLTNKPALAPAQGGNTKPK
jgi:tetratricopeptide (TPR) repeat protein